MSRSAPSLRQVLGCWLHERRQAESILRTSEKDSRPGRSWLDLANRGERLRIDPVTGGRSCAWSESSTLTVDRIFPEVGLRLMRKALHEWPMDFRAPDEKLARPSSPDVSLLVPVGGLERLPQFHLCLAAARAQEGIAVEIVVAEQSTEPQLAAALPEDVVYLHQLPARSDAAFNKSRAVNAAARAARGHCLVLLDADMLLPRAFCREASRVLERVEATRPARLLFNLDRDSTVALSADRQLDGVRGLDSIVANSPNPIAVRAQTYREIGGHDEAYVGWGGEDTEFLDRLRTRATAEGGWMPVLHAWHASAPAKAPGRKNADFHRETMRLSAAERIRRLAAPDSRA